MKPILSLFLTEHTGKHYLTVAVVQNLCLILKASSKMLNIRKSKMNYCVCIAESLSFNHCKFHVELGFLKLILTKLSGIGGRIF